MRKRERELDSILLSFLEFVSHVGVEAFHSIQTMLLLFLSLSSMCLFAIVYIFSSWQTTLSVGQNVRERERGRDPWKLKKVYTLESLTSAHIVSCLVSRRCTPPPSRPPLSLQAKHHDECFTWCCRRCCCRQRRLSCYCCCGCYWRCCCCCAWTSLKSFRHDSVVCWFVTSNSNWKEIVNSINVENRNPEIFSIRVIVHLCLLSF